MKKWYNVSQHPCLLVFHKIEDIRTVLHIIKLYFILQLNMNFYIEVIVFFLYASVSGSPSIVFSSSICHLLSVCVCVCVCACGWVCVCERLALPPVRQPYRRALSPETEVQPNRSPPTSSTPGHHPTLYIASNTQTHPVSPLPQRSSPLLSPLLHLSTCMAFTVHT